VGTMDMGTVTRGGNIYACEIGYGAAIASTSSENLHLTNLF